MSFRYALAKYIKDPEKYEDCIVYHDSNVVIVFDQFPKSAVHYLVMPRSKIKTKQNPLTVFRDVQFKDQMDHYIELAIDHAVKEFESKFTYKDGYEDFNIRDFIQVGVHSVPSMNNLHVHVLTKDFETPRMKNKKHYNSFNTQFFVEYEELPLSASKTKFDEPRYDAIKMEAVIKQEDLRCRYCKKNFSNKFADLKNHLHEEFILRFEPR